MNDKVLFLMKIRKLVLEILNKKDKCALCGFVIEPYEWDIKNAFNEINPLTFRKANMHYDCFRDAMDIAEETPSKNKQRRFANRLDEYLTIKING